MRNTSAQAREKYEALMHQHDPIPDQGEEHSFLETCLVEGIENVAEEGEEKDPLQDSGLYTDFIG